MLRPDDVRRLYAKINAHEILLRACIRAIASITEDPDVTIERIRADAMDKADTLKRKQSDPNPDLVDNARIDTLLYVAETMNAIIASQSGEKD